MSAHAEVPVRRTGSEPATEPAPEGLHVRPPTPIPPRERRVLAVVVVAALLIGLILVVQARSEDGNTVPGGAWRELPVPRAARVDDFDRPGPLGEVADFGTWQVASSTLIARDGTLRSTGDQVVATVDAGTSDVLVHAQVVQVSSEAGFLLSATGDGSAGLWLVTSKGAEGWQLEWQRGTADPAILDSFPEPRLDVSVQVSRQGNRVRVAFDTKAYEVDVPPESAAGTFVGITSAHPGNELDLFGYLPLDAG